LNENPQQPALSVQDIVKATGGTIIGRRTETVFQGISTDSRQTVKGNLFIPLTGETFDGHDFIGNAIKEGAAGYLIQKGSEKKTPHLDKHITAISVEDTLKALGDIANFWRRKLATTIIAITGSSGKTTTKEMIACIASLTKKVVKAEGSFNNFVGLPLTIMRIAEQHDVAILEMGTNRPGEIRRLTQIAEPDIGLITNIGPAHLEGLKSIEAVKEEKCDLFRNMAKEGIAVINCDDENLYRPENFWQEKRVLFGFRTYADVSASNVRRKGVDGVRFTLTIGGNQDNIALATVGNHNIYNALAAAAISRALGIEYHVIRRGLRAFKPVTGRMEIYRLTNGAFVIDDTYNANPASVREALKTLKELKGRHRSTVIMGDMLELGNQAEAMHEEIGSLMADTEIDTIYLRGRLSHATAAGALKRNMSKNRIFFFEHQDEVIPGLMSNLKKGDWILVKGSRKMHMEEIVHKIVDTFGLGKERRNEERY